MKQPCKDCPFQKSVKYSLSPEKADEILQAITHDRAFQCHKTVDYSDSHEGQVTSESRLCFGAVLFLENTVRGGCRSNVMFRFGLMRKEFRLDDLGQDESVYQSFFHVGSFETLITSFPFLLPSKSFRIALGAFSKPSTISTAYLIFPWFSHFPISAIAS